MFKFDIHELCGCFHVFFKVQKYRCLLINSRCYGKDVSLHDILEILLEFSIL